MIAPISIAEVDVLTQDAQRQTLLDVLNAIADFGRRRAARRAADDVALELAAHQPDANAPTPSTSAARPANMAQAAQRERRDPRDQTATQPKQAAC